MGRAPCDSTFSAGRHALFESSAPIERFLAPVYRHLIRGRAAALQGGTAVYQGSVSSTGFETSLSIARLGVSSAELGGLLRSYAGDIPRSVALVIAARPELVGPSGTHEPLRVIAGTVFAMVTRASYSVRLKWFQPFGWWRVPCMLRGLGPCSREDKSALRFSRRREQGCG